MASLMAWLRQASQNTGLTLNESATWRIQWCSRSNSQIVIVDLESGAGIGGGDIDGWVLADCAELAGLALEGRGFATQGTLYLAQAPQIGWASSHLMCFSLHLLQPDRDFVWGRRDGIGDAEDKIRNTENEIRAEQGVSNQLCWSIPVL